MVRSQVCRGPAPLVAPTQSRRKPSSLSDQVPARMDCWLGLFNQVAHGFDETCAIKRFTYKGTPRYESNPSRREVPATLR